MTGNPPHVIGMSINTREETAQLFDNLEHTLVELSEGMLDLLISDEKRAKIYAEEYAAADRGYE